MTFKVRLLVVEDDSAETKAWQRVVEAHNVEPEKHEFVIEASYATSLKDAVGKMEGQDFDAAVVDIRLEQHGVAAAPNSDGNQVVETLLASELAVVAVFTGEQLEVAVPDWAKNLVQLFRKGGDEGEGTSAVMEWLGRQIPMIKAIRQAELTIKKEMVQLFTRSIWPRWGDWMRQGAPVHLETALSRHLASHIHATLLEDSKQQVHPEEWYFIPPIRDGIRTGDLMNIAHGVYEVVITPRCDLAIENKVETIQLAECLSVKEKWDQLCVDMKAAETALNSNTDPNKTAKLKEKIDQAKEKVRKFTQHAGSKASVHFLPPMNFNGGSLGPFLVQFDKIRSVKKSAGADMDALRGGRVASLTPEFLPSLVERLGGYFSRIGTPDYSHPD